MALALFTHRSLHPPAGLAEGQTRVHIRRPELDRARPARSPAPLPARPPLAAGPPSAISWAALARARPLPRPAPPGGRPEGRGEGKSCPRTRFHPVRSESPAHGEPARCCQDRQEELVPQQMQRPAWTGPGREARREGPAAPGAQRTAAAKHVHPGALRGPHPAASSGPPGTGGARPGVRGRRTLTSPGAANAQRGAASQRQGWGDAAASPGRGTGRGAPSAPDRKGGATGERRDTPVLGARSDPGRRLALEDVLDLTPAYARTPSRRDDNRERRPRPHFRPGCRPFRPRAPAHPGAPGGRCRGEPPPAVRAPPGAPARPSSRSSRRGRAHLMR